MSETIASDVSAGFTLTLPQSGFALMKGLTQSYSLTFEPSSASPPQTMMSSSPSPAPIEVGRSELGPPEGAVEPPDVLALGAPAEAGGGAEAAFDGLGLAAEPLQADATIPMPAAAASQRRDLTLLLLQLLRSQSCAVASR